MFFVDRVVIDGGRRGVAKRAILAVAWERHKLLGVSAGAIDVGSSRYERSLVGRSLGRDFPATVKRWTVCAEPRIDVSGTSRQIDRAVHSAVRDAFLIHAASAKN